MSEPTPEPKKRRSTSVASRLDVPEPSERVKRKYKKLAELCAIAVATNCSNDTKHLPKNRVRVVFKRGKVRKAIAPKGWPKGEEVFVEGTPPDKVVMSYNAELVLIWMYERKIVDYTPSMLYKERQKFFLQITQMENSMLDTVELEEYDSDTEE